MTSAVLGKKGTPCLLSASSKFLLPAKNLVALIHYREHLDKCFCVYTFIYLSVFYQKFMLGIL